MDFRDHIKAAQTDFEAHYIENDHIQLRTLSLSLSVSIPHWRS